MGYGYIGYVGWNSAGNHIRHRLTIVYYIIYSRKTMKLALIGPGIMSIPPKGWGAVEILIWDYYCALKHIGIDVEIINIPIASDIIKAVNMGNFDVVHIHYDVFCNLIPYIKCKNVFITSHYPYIEQFDKHAKDGYDRVFKILCNNNSFTNVCISRKDYDIFLHHSTIPTNVKFLRNSINHEKYTYECNWNVTNERSICLGKIEPRKGQFLIQNIPTIDFVGPLQDPKFSNTNKNYLGEWTKDEVYKKLTKYTNLVLVSEGEADPLVVKEALICGLGLVITKKCCENLDTTLPFITVLDDEVVYNQEKMTTTLISHINNLTTNPSCKRDIIRQYGITQFSMKNTINDYIQIIS